MKLKEILADEIKEIQNKENLNEGQKKVSIEGLLTRIQKILNLIREHQDGEYAWLSFSDLQKVVANRRTLNKTIHLMKEKGLIQCAKNKKGGETFKHQKGISKIGTCPKGYKINN